MNPQPLPPKGITVHVTRDIASDLEKINKVTANVMRELGCPSCCSGHELAFRVIEDFVVDPQTLDVANVIPGQRF